MTKKILLTILLLSSSLFAEVLSSTKPAIKKIVKVESAMNLRVTLKLETKRAQKLNLDIFNIEKKNFLHVDAYPKGKTHIFNVPVQKGTYIVLLHTKSPQWYHSPFKLSISKVKSYYEIEPNESFKTASPLYIKKYIKGYLQSKRKTNDIDMYKLITKEKANLTLTINHKASNNALYTVTVYNKQKKEILEFNSDFNKSSTTKFLPLRRGLYYVKVSSPKAILNNEEYKLTYVLNKIQEE